MYGSITENHARLERFLKTFNISLERTDILEEIFLQLARIESIPKACRFQCDPEYNQVCFIIRGILEQDALRFSEYLKKEGGDKNVTYVKGNQYGSFSPKETYSFTVNAPIFYEKILPLFKNEVIHRSKLADKDPRSLLQYKIITQTKIREEQVRKEQEGFFEEVTSSCFVYKRAKLAAQSYSPELSSEEEIEEAISKTRTRPEPKSTRVLSSSEELSYDPVVGLYFYDTKFVDDKEDENASNAPGFGK